MSNDGYKNCPFCDEEIKVIAVKCRYCKSLLIDEKKINNDNDENLNEELEPSVIVSTEATAIKKKNKKLLLLVPVGIALVFFIIFAMSDLLTSSVMQDVDNTINNETDISDTPEELNEELLTIPDTYTSIEEDVKWIEPEPILYTVDVDILRLRQEPTTDSEIIDRLERNTDLLLIYETIATNERWMQVITPKGIRGWVHGDYVRVQPDLSKVYDIKNARAVVLEAKKDKDFYNDPLLQTLGWTKERIWNEYGQPDTIEAVSLEGGDAFTYEDIGIIFLFGAGEGVVNDIVLRPGAILLGVDIGYKNFDEIETIIGRPTSRGPIEEGADVHISSYWLGDHYGETAEVEIYFYADSVDQPPDYVYVHWKKYWW